MITTSPIPTRTLVRRVLVYYGPYRLLPASDLIAGALVAALTITVPCLGKDPPGLRGYQRRHRGDQRQGVENIISGIRVMQSFTWEKQERGLYAEPYNAQTGLLPERD